MATLCFVVNDWTSLDTAASTVAWIRRAAEDHRVVVVAADGLAVRRGGRVVAHAREGLEGPQVLVDLDTVDAVVVRTNPGRDARAWVNAVLLQTLQLAEDRGVPVVNRPGGLYRAASKLYLAALPGGSRPPTMVSRSAEAIRDFLRELDGPAVIKPIAGTHGEDVFRVDGPDGANLPQIVSTVTRGGPAMVQGFVEHAATGDVRVHLVGGELLCVDGVPAAVGRIPPDGDFRSNVHLGGTPVPVTDTEMLEEVAALVGPRLRADGLWHVGLDVIGGLVVEVNAYSPGGFTDVARFTGKDVLGAMTEALLSHVGVG